MRVKLSGKTIRLQPKNLLGVGGEARVYAHGDRALKIFHPIDSALSGSALRREEALRELRRQKIESFPRPLPLAVIAPQDVVYDEKGARMVGYAMRRLEDAHDLLHLSRRSWREGVVSNQQVVALFRNLYLTLEILHRRGVVVGDLNDGNVMLTLGGGPRALLIDADSMQFAQFPCVMAHERFLDPRLYGVDLAAQPAFDATTDWYAFSVLLFSSLLYVHPYGGVHPTLPTLLRRAEARISVLDGSVTRPRAAADPAVLPDALLEHFRQTFDRDLRGVFPAALLELCWARCKACGLEHARPACPACRTSVGARKAPPPAPLAAPATIIQGRCRATTIERTRGRILFATIQGKLRYLLEEDGVVRREDGSRVLEQDIVPQMRFAIAGSSTWIGLGERLVRVQHEACVERARTTTFFGAPAFDANANACFRVQEDTLVECHSDRRFGQVLGGQTWLRVDSSLGFGFYRAGLLMVGFLFDPHRPGLRMIDLPAVDGHLVDASATFDHDRVLLGIASEKAGKRRHTLMLIDRSGRVLGSLAGAPEESPLLQSIDGKALLSGALVMATESGLMRVGVEASGRLVEERIFADTQRFVGADVALLPGPAHSIYVVNTQAITQLTLA